MVQVSDQEQEAGEGEPAGVDQHRLPGAEIARRAGRPEGVPGRDVGARDQPRAEADVDRLDESIRQGRLDCPPLSEYAFHGYLRVSMSQLESAHKLSSTAERSRYVGLDPGEVVIDRRLERARLSEARLGGQHLRPRHQESPKRKRLARLLLASGREPGARSLPELFNLRRQTSRVAVLVAVHAAKDG